MTKLLAWIAIESGRSKDVRYDMTRHDATVLLEQVAGWDPIWAAKGIQSDEQR